MPWDDFDNVIFDVGNVLVAFDPDAILQELFPVDAAKRALLKNVVFRSPIWAMLDRGTITRADAASAMAALHPEYLEDVRYVLSNWDDLKVTIDEGIRTLKACKAHGKKCYVLSNYHDEAFAFVRKKFDFFGLFDGFVVSADIHLLKPAPEIFHYLLDKFALDGARSVFIDDTPANIEGAMHCGIEGVCFNASGVLADFFGG